MGLQPRNLSFKHTVQIWTQWTSLHFAWKQDRRDILFKLTAQITVGQRPGRLEPDFDSCCAHGRTLFRQDRKLRVL